MTFPVAGGIFKLKEVHYFIIKEIMFSFQMLISMASLWWECSTAVRLIIKSYIKSYHFYFWTLWEWYVHHTVQTIGQISRQVKYCKKSNRRLYNILAMLEIAYSFFFMFSDIFQCCWNIFRGEYISVNRDIAEYIYILWIYEYSVNIYIYIYREYI